MTRSCICWPFGWPGSGCCSRRMPGAADGLHAAWRVPAQCVERAAAALQDDWLWQAALEHSWQAPLCRGLAAGAQAAAREDTPAAVQAVFCIDVRSEVYRRALEAASAQRVQTLGFAGFFAMSHRLPGRWAARWCARNCPGCWHRRCASRMCATSRPWARCWHGERRRNLAWRQQWQQALPAVPDPDLLLRRNARRHHQAGEKPLRRRKSAAPRPVQEQTGENPARAARAQAAARRSRRRRTRSRTWHNASPWPPERARARWA